jgi:hypothetical protein
MGGKPKREVYDFLMSIDYGLCHGPVDAINQVWVKDKPIWCGWEKVRADKDVNQPDLFGGDDAEGGCVGVAEFYPGDDDQVSSDELASRTGRTPATMPGYRGLAHLFFRGGGNSGFRWSSNNPYLPPVKASVTRIPTSLDPVNSRIMPPVGVAEDGSFIPASITAAGDGFTDDVVSALPTDTPEARANALYIASSNPAWTNTNLPRVDLLSLGLTREELDTLVGNPNFTAKCGFDGYTWDAGGPVAGQFFAEIGFFPDDGTGNPDFANPIVSPPGSGPQSDYSNEVGNKSISVECLIPANARFVIYKAWIVLWSPFFEYARVDYRYRGLKYPDLDYAHCKPDGTLGTLPDANPAHVIYECMVNAEWGRGEDPALIDVASFNAAAQVFYDEFMGISFGWYRSDKVATIIQEVLDHVQAALYQNPATGLWELKPLRGGYSTVGLRTLDPSNCTIDNPKRRAWGETVNEIVVSYTDPQTEEEATVVSHNLGSIAVQGGVISEPRNYYAFRNPFIAQKVADRDVAASGYPLFSAQVTANREFWDVNPGDVLFFSWPAENITNMIVRVMDVDRGTINSRKVVIDIVEDVFAVEQTAYSSPQGSLWTTDRIAPADMPYKAAVTAPLPTLVRLGGDIAEIDSRYPEVGTLLMADQLPRPFDVEAHTAVVKTNGSTVVEAVSTFPVARSGTIPAALVPEVASTLPGLLVADVLSQAPDEGDLLMLGDDEATGEIVMLDSYDAGLDEWTVARGIWDTIPRDWPAGTRLWAFPDSSLRTDPTIRAAGENVTYWYLPRTTEGRLPISQATPVDYTATERPHLPFRPANCQLDGTGFAGVDYSFGTTGVPVPATITATWENRNRTSEDSVALKWDGGTVAGEAGQTTVLRVLDVAGVLDHEITGLSGTSYAIDTSTLVVDHGFIEFVSEASGRRSMMGLRLPFDVRQGGYGQGYGQYYGP